MSEPDYACLTQRLHRLLWSSLALQDSTIKILERLTLQREPPEPIDVASLTDRLHEVFNAYSFLTRCNGWHDIDDEQEEPLEDQQDHSQPP